jgi:hypothetical protein
MRKLLSFVFIFSFVCPTNISCQVVVPFDSNWEYFKGTTSPNGGENVWQKYLYPDTDWLSGNMPFCYGNGDNGTVLTDMKNGYSSIYLRKKVKINTVDSLFKKLIITADYEDGFRMWVNGQVVIERNVPLTDGFDSVATSTHAVGDKEIIEIYKSNSAIVNGENIIAVQCYTAGKSRPGFYYDVKIETSENQVTGPEVKFDKGGGYFSSGFDIVITSSGDIGDTIKYTVDCSEPANSGSAKIGQSPLTLHIDTNSFIGRPKTPAVVIRAAVVKKGFEISNSESRTYIFTEAVKRQTAPGGNWPKPNFDSNIGQLIDYDVDPRVINDSRYKTKINSALLSVPTFSIVTDVKNLFDSTSGIYVHAAYHGQAWERPSSLELLNSDGTGFSVNTGLRIRGGWSRHNDNPKHAFRIMMNNDYGKKKLKYPLFEKEGVDEFEKFDLRCAENYSWSYGNDPRFTYTRDVFSRDAQGVAVQPYTRSRYYQLFVDGMYWGLYQTDERPEAAFGASYLGGKKEDFDVIKINIEDNFGYAGIEATDGTLDKWKKAWDMCVKGFAPNEAYYKIQGLDNKGRVDTTLETLVDIDNLIDYMLNIFYTGNFDAPVTKFGNDKSVNNFFALKNRTRTREGFIFISHDAEHTMQSDVGVGPGTLGVNENRVNIGNLPASNQYKMVISDFIQFNPQWLHFKLCDNIEYRLRFADRAYKALNNNGLFTPVPSENRWRGRAAQIDVAVIGESARWGDSRSSGKPRTRDDDWIPAVNKEVNRFIKLRTPIVIKQLSDVNLYGSAFAPQIYKNGVLLDSQVYNLTGPINVTFTSQDVAGKIFYTLDGTDPRVTSGSVNSTAMEAFENTNINIPYPLKLKARVLNGSDWSPAHEVVFTNTENRVNIRVTEIQYYPSVYGSQGQKDLEFIELKNIGDKGVDLGGLRLDSAVKYTFPQNTIINPHGFVVICSNRNGFEFLYGMKPTGEFSGNLSNEGEQIVLLNENDSVLINMVYNVSSPWPTDVKNTGHSLVAVAKNPNSDPNDPAFWRSSRLVYGSPFGDDSAYVKPSLVSDNSISICSVYPNPSSDVVYIDVKATNSIKSIKLFDLSGRLVYTMPDNNFKNIGANIEISFSNLNIREGLYLLKLQTNKTTEIHKLIYKK